MTNWTRYLIPALLALGVSACEDDNPLPTGGGADSAAPDSAVLDAAPGDMALPDAGAPDLHIPDMGAPDSSPPPWKAPTCNIISGFAGIGFGFQDGKAITASQVAFPGGKTYTSGLVALTRPNTLVAIHEASVYRSEDAGCTWTKVGAVEMKGLTLTAGVGDVAWAWRAATDYLYRIQGAQIGKVTLPLQSLMGLQPHATKAGTLRIGGKGGELQESTDAGKTWSKLSAGTSTGNSTYVVAFNPGDLTHAIVGSSHKGFSVTTDSGKTWKVSTGLSSSSGKVNGFTAVFSPADPKVVWANAIDLAMSGASNGRQIYRSADGGLTFTEVVVHQQHKDVILSNGMPMYPHPKNVNRLYFTWGTCASMYGTNLYRYDAQSKKLTWDNHAFPGFGPVVVSPADPSFLYLAIHGNDDPFCPLL